MSRQSAKVARRKEAKRQRTAENKRSAANNNKSSKQKANQMAVNIPTPTTPAQHLELLRNPHIPTPAPRGLQNLGNTCYFNSVMQNLARITPFRDYFVGTTPAAEEGPMTSALRAFFIAMWGMDNMAPTNNSNRYSNDKVLNPSKLLDQVGNANVSFAGRAQHDAHELMRVVFDAVVEEEKARKKKVKQGFLPPGPTEVTGEEQDGQPLTDNSNTNGIGNGDSNNGVSDHETECGSDIATGDGENDDAMDDLHQPQMNGTTVTTAKNDSSDSSCDKDGDEDGTFETQSTIHLPPPPFPSSPSSSSSSPSSTATTANGNHHLSSSTPNNSNTTPKSNVAKAKDKTTATQVQIPADKLATVIDKAVGGTLTSTIFCRTCKSKSSVFEPFFDLQLPLVPKDDADAKRDEEAKAAKSAKAAAAAANSGKNKGGRGKANKNNNNNNNKATTTTTEVPPPPPPPPTTENASTTPTPTPIPTPTPPSSASSSSTATKSTAPPPPPPPPPPMPAIKSTKNKAQTENNSDKQGQMFDVMSQLKNMSQLRERADSATEVEMTKPMDSFSKHKYTSATSVQVSPEVSERSLVVYEGPEPQPQPTTDDAVKVSTTNSPAAIPSSFEALDRGRVNAVLQTDSEDDETRYLKPLFDSDADDDNEGSDGGKQESSSSSSTTTTTSTTNGTGANSTNTSRRNITSRRTARNTSGGSSFFNMFSGFGSSGNAPHGYRSLLASMEEFTKVEVLEDDNAYGCEECTRRKKLEIALRRKREANNGDIVVGTSSSIKKMKAVVQHKQQQQKMMIDNGEINSSSPMCETRTNSSNGIIASNGTCENPHRTMNGTSENRSVNVQNNDNSNQLGTVTSNHHHAPSDAHPQENGGTARNGTNTTSTTATATGSTAVRSASGDSASSNASSVAKTSSSEEQVLMSSPVTSSESSSGVSSEEDNDELVIEEVTQAQAQEQEVQQQEDDDEQQEQSSSCSSLTREGEDHLIKEMGIDLLDVDVVRTTAEKRMMIKRPPNVLALQLKRFTQHGFRGALRKMTGHVDFETDVDLTPFVDNDDQGNIQYLYTLTGIAVHTGSLHGGHYYAYVRHDVNNNNKINNNNNNNNNNDDDRGGWLLCNDSRVSRASENDVLTAEAYLLIYERV